MTAKVKIMRGMFMAGRLGPLLPDAKAAGKVGEQKETSTGAQECSGQMAEGHPTGETTGSERVNETKAFAG